MAPQRGAVREAQLAFDALSIEGGLLGAEWLGKLAQLEASAQALADYRIPKGLHLRDEIARSWRIAQACFQELEAGRASGGNALALAERFVEGLLRDAFGFTSIVRADPTVLGERVYPVRFFALGDRVPIVVAPAGAGLDAPLPELGDGRRRRSAFGLLQEVLNALSAARWGLTSDGLVLRLARDNASLTRPAWIEADLARIFTESLYPDFAALWLLVHESRFGRAEESADTCPLEAWREAGRQEGTRAREKLSVGFERALEILGHGFLSHPANTGLRSALHAGDLTRDNYFGQLLRLVYRLIFLLTVEERNLLHPKSAPDAARHLYAEGYTLRRLRDRAIRRSAHDRQGDLWEVVKIVFRGLATGEPRLGLPALAGLFASEECPELDGAMLENRALLGALFHLAWLREPSGLVRVNWRDMGPDELGYVYEGLLELVPQITKDGRSFSFASADESRGHARKTTGSYYTPDELVQLLLASALDPVVKRAVDAHPDRPVDALLDLAVVDPACGSGHFLLAAARRLADHVARIRAAGTPTPDDYQRALRDVVRRCIYGVDMNPLAVELCKVSLWMESIDPGLPLTFLESHIRRGNALLGTTRGLMGDQVPDAAWIVLEGDDKNVTTSLKRRNKEEIAGQRLLRLERRNGTGALRDAMRAIEQAPDADVAALAEKECQWKALLGSQAYEHEKLVADAWCAAFLWPKDKPGPVVETAPTTATWLALRDKEAPPSEVLVETTRHIAEDYVLFHWELAFPHVFARGGFDVVLGNPPWEHIELKEQEFFARREPSIADAQNAAIRKDLIAALPVTSPQLWEEWQLAKRKAQGEMHFARSSGRFPLCARGRINTYPLFAEHNWGVLAPHGRAGFIVPSGIATDDMTKEYFQALLDRRVLASIYHFENEGLVFKGLHHAYRFVLLTIGEAERADLVFYARRVLDLDDEERHFALAPADFATLNPNTHTCPTFRWRRDAEMNLALYSRTNVLWREGDPDGNPWGLRFMQGLFNMASDAALFRTRGELVAAGWTPQGNRFVKDREVMLPLYEAKMIHNFDHRFGTYEGQTEAQSNQGKLPELDDAAHANPRRVTLARYWVTQTEIESRLEGVSDRGWLLGWRDITGTEKVRTVIACVIPRVGVGHTLPLMFPTPDAHTVACLCANLASLCFDYAARQKVGGTHLTYSYLKQLPVLPPSIYPTCCPWNVAQALRDWFLPRVLELTYTAWDLKPFAEDCGDDGPPYIWDPERRFQLQCELDAAFFHLYSIPPDDAGYILDTFPVLARSDERAYGEYRTKRMVLDVYDALAGAAAAGRSYVSPLGPPTRAS
ncbi:MAG: N-6 DNA methylase [Candidatus Rokubacteria bacterium]|nr:N-6 DNA methylase [Candidatus Rokubacteria bacterium]